MQNRPGLAPRGRWRRLKLEEEEMLRAVKAFIQREELVQAGDWVVIACSGGPDSLALLHIMWRLRPELGIKLAAAHVDHMLRGTAAQADAQFVRDFCDRLQLPCHLAVVDVPARVKASGQSVEEAGRELRYRFLRQVAAHYGPTTKIAVGHNLDDQAETVLLHLLRGAGSQGLGGMAPRTPDGIIRPLLEMTRQDIEIYCRENDLTPRRDITNWDLAYTRNKIRWELLPLLKDHYNPAISRLLAQTAQVLRDEHAYIAATAARVVPALVTVEADGAVELSLVRWRRLHPALQREVMRLAVGKIIPSLKGITFTHVETLLAMGRRNGVARYTLPGPVYVQTAYGRMRLDRRPPAPAPAPAPPLSPAEVRLVVPGVTPLGWSGLAVTAAIVSSPPAARGGYQAVLDYDALEPPLFVRTRRPGDRFVPLGAPGEKKLQDFFVDAKVPRTERDTVPLVCDQRGIVWVAGWRPAERAKVTPATQRFLWLQLQRTEEDN